jgi:AbrB family looped-hinge helix DNA binding protein
MWYEMSVVKLSSKGQVVIPAKLRRELGLSDGDSIIISREDDALVLKPVVRISRLRGVDRIENASGKLEKARKEWDEEWNEGTK